MAMSFKDVARPLKPTDMYGRYPPYIQTGNRVVIQPPDNRKVIYGVLAGYTVVICLVGFFVGQQAFDPIEQAKFEARHWLMQSTTWTAKVNEWKTAYNRHANLMAGEPEPCPVCKDCNPPSFCYPKPGAHCTDCGFAAAPGEPILWDGSGYPPASNVNYALSGLSVPNPYSAPAVKQEAAPTAQTTADGDAGGAPTAQPFGTELPNGETAPELEAEAVGAEAEVAAKPKLKRKHASLFSMLGWHKEQEGSEDSTLECPACPICRNNGVATQAQLAGMVAMGDNRHTACDKQALLEKIQETRQTLEAKREAKKAPHQQRLNEYKHCLQLTMPAVHDALEDIEIAKGRGR